MTSTIKTTPAAGRGITIRRALTSTLQYLASLVDVAGLYATLALLACSGFNTGPDWAQLSATGALVATLAIYGGGQILIEVLDHAASMADPDVRDGQQLHAAANAIDAARHDLNGGERDDVRTSLRESHLLRSVAHLLDDLAPDGGLAAQAPLRDAATAARAAQAALGTER